MEKLTNYISKKVISIEEGKYVGYVLDVLIDNDLNKVEGLIVADEESEQNFILDYKKIINHSENLIMISSLHDLNFTVLENFNNPMGKIVLDRNGINLGRVEEVYIDGQNIKKIVTNKCEFWRKYIYSFSENYIIFGLKRNKIRKNNYFKNITNNSQILPKVSIEEYKMTNKNNQSISPYKLYAQQEKLLGRKIVCDILGYNNELVAKKDDIINQKIINKAKIHNKLSLLNYYSK